MESKKTIWPIIAASSAFIVSLSVATYAWITEEQSITGEYSITLRSGESVAKLEISGYSFVNDTLSDNLFFHNSTSDQNYKCSIRTSLSQEEQDSGSVYITFDELSFDANVLNTGYDDITTPGFNADTLPMFIFEVRVIKEAFGAYMLASSTVTSSSMKYYTTSVNSQTAVNTEDIFTYRELVVTNSAIDETPKYTSATEYQENDKYTNVQALNVVDGINYTGSNIDLCSVAGSVTNQNTNLDAGNYKSQLWIPAFDMKADVPTFSSTGKGDDEERAIFSKSIMFGIYINPETFLDTYYQTSVDGIIDKSVVYYLRFKFDFELSNDPFLN